MPNRITNRSDNVLHDDPVKAGAHIYRGTVVCLDAAGFAVPGSAVAGLIARGIAQDEVDNTGGGDGAKSVHSRSGTHGLDLKTGDAPTQADIGSLVYLTADAEVGKTATARSPAGYLAYLEGTQAFVDITGRAEV